MNLSRTDPMSPMDARHRGSRNGSLVTNPTELRGLEVVGLLFLDAGGRILDADVRARVILGVRLQRLQGRALLDVVPGAGDALQRAASTGDNVSLGEAFAAPAEDCIAVAVHPAPTGFTVPIRNRQDHRRDAISQRLRERILASIPSGMAVLDATAPELDVMWVNEAFQTLTGHDLESLGATGVRSLAPDPDDPDSELDGALAFAAAGEAVKLQTRLRHAGGAPFWADLTFSPVRDERARTTHVLLVLEDVTERVQADIVLEESERRYRLLAERSSDIVARHNADGDPIYVSPAIERILGYDPDEYPDLNPWQFVHPEDVGRLRAELAAVARGAPAPPRVLLRTCHADGHYVWLEMNVTVVRNESGGIAEIVTVSRDVTERMAAERELQRSQQSFSHLFAANPVPMWVHDARSLEVLEVNAAAAELLGYSRDELVSATTSEFVPEEDRARYLATVEASAPDRAQHLGDVNIQRRDGTIVIAALDKSPLTFRGREARLVVARDMSEARRAQRALGASELRFRRLVERSTDVLAISNNQGSLTYVSDAVEAITGWAPHELVGTPFAGLIHPDDLPAARQFRRDIDVHGTATIPLYRFRQKEGGWRWFEAVGRDLRDEPAVRGVVINTRDVTERVAHLQEIEATREATFRALGVALEHRDLETRGHTDRVVAMSQRFARALGFTPRQVQAITWGAYLHDLGKVAMPDAILLKPGRLTKEEFAVIKRHTLIGEAMCRDIPFLPDTTRQLIRSHHERWDGTGYPDGIAGEAIPLKARMFAIVDVYDALLSKRPYKRAWSRAEAEAELRKQAGEQFDPELVPVFLDRVLD